VCVGNRQSAVRLARVFERRCIVRWAALGSAGFRRRAVRAARIVRAAAEGGSALVEYREAWDV